MLTNPRDALSGQYKTIHSGHRNWYHSADWLWFPIRLSDSALMLTLCALQMLVLLLLLLLLVFYRKSVPKTHRF